MCDSVTKVLYRAERRGAENRCECLAARAQKTITFNLQLNHFFSTSLRRPLSLVAKLCNAHVVCFGAGTSDSRRCTQRGERSLQIKLIDQARTNNEQLTASFFDIQPSPSRRSPLPRRN